MMAELEIPTSNWAHVDAPPSWWENFVYNGLRDWHEVVRVLDEDWNAEVRDSPIVGEIGKIIFENERDITMFLLRWS